MPVAPDAPDAEVLAAAAEWCSWDTNAETREAVRALIDAEDMPALRASMCASLTFGTAGLRGPMIAGYGGMNELTVVQATQGLALYLEQAFGKDKAAAAGVCIGWDHRAAGSLNSERFALLAAEVFAQRKIRVVLLPDLVPTPFVSFCVSRNNCAAGIMITASHNPKADNGYKVYWENGAQIVPPHDTGIATCIAEAMAPWAEYGKVGGVAELLAAYAGGMTTKTEAIATEYFAKVRERLCRHADANREASPVVYTAMHGVGGPWLLRAFEAFSLPRPVPVDEQMAPDPTFPTVAFPNPEEGAGALALAFAAAERCGATLVLANDPDADRLAVAERPRGGGPWRVLSGNEIGVLLADWEVRQFKRRHAGADLPRAALLSSAVSSRMVAALAAAEGLHHEETLTGFKWLCSRGAALAADGYEVLLAYEEAIGFCLGGVVNDKDGVSAGAVFAEMAGTLAREEGRSVCEHLDALAARLGHFVQNNGYVVCRQPAVTAAIFDRLRNGGHYWLRIGDDTVVGVRDLTTGVDTDAADGRATLPTSSSSHMVTLRFGSGAVATLRGSGTEPKIKWCAEIIEWSSSSEVRNHLDLPACRYAELKGADRAAAIAKLSALVDALVGEVLQPEANGLEMRK